MLAMTREQLAEFLATEFPQTRVTLEEVGEGVVRVRQRIGFEHLRPGLPAEISGQQRGRHASGGMRLDDQGQDGRHPDEAGALVGAEAGGAIGREGDRLMPAGREGQRHGQVIRRALLPQLAQQARASPAGP